MVLFCVFRFSTASVWKCPAIFTSNIFKPGRHPGSSFTQARTNFWTDKNLRNRHVSGFTLVPRLLWEYWQQSMRRGGHLENSIHGKEPGSILLRHRINKYPGLVSTLESAFKTMQVLMLDSPDTCGRKAYPERKSCGLKNIWIRVEGVYGMPVCYACVHSI